MVTMIIRWTSPLEETQKDQTELARQIVARSRFFSQFKISEDDIFVSGKSLVDQHLLPTRWCYANPNDICFCNFVPIFPLVETTATLPYLDEVGYFTDRFRSIFVQQGVRYILVLDPTDEMFVGLYDLQTDKVMELDSTFEVGLIAIIPMTVVDYPHPLASEVPE